MTHYEGKFFDRNGNCSDFDTFFSISKKYLVLSVDPVHMTDIYHVESLRVENTIEVS